MIGSTLDKYEVLQKVGEGGMATVYRGRHNTLDRDVAIKVLHPHLSSSPRNRKRFAREARAIEHLRHDNILEIFDYSGMDASDCYIITEYVEGDTLTAMLRSRRRLPSEVVAIVGLHLAHALAYAHAEGILHRDLKPDNVMLRWDGTLKLMDFGIARFLDESQVTMTGALVGSPAFMSPEQAREGVLDHRSDLFSVGTMLFYLVTGQLPFSGSNPSLILKNVIEANRPSVAELAPAMSAALSDIIERLMSTQPDDRYDDAGQVAEALQAMLAESNVDPDDTRWSLKQFIEHPDDYQDHLADHLRQVLILRGRERLSAGDHLGALRLFNRLLAFDEHNDEVLGLVQGLHHEPRGRVGGRALIVLALLLAVVGGVAYAWVVTDRASRQADAQAAFTGAETAPSSDRDGLDVPPPESLPLPSPSPQSVAAPVPDPVVATPAVVPATRPSATRPSRPTVVRPEPAPVVEPESEGLAEADLEEEMGTLRFSVTNELVGVIFVDGLRLGTRGEVRSLDVKPGTHRIEYRGYYLRDWSQDVVVGPGEKETVFITPVVAPRTVSFPTQGTDAWSSDCRVVLDDRDMGTIADLTGVLTVTTADKAHVIAVRCNKGVGGERRYNLLTSDETFPGPAAFGS